MKKKSIVFSIAVIAAALFGSICSEVNTKSNVTLASLIAINTANAGEMDPDGDICSDEDNEICYVGEGLQFSGCEKDGYFTLSDCFK